MRDGPVYAAQEVQASTHEQRADALPLPIRQDGHGGEAHAHDASGGGRDDDGRK